jgi:ABC-type transport system involved in multi-copper enzyme maturation permease subunit
LRRELQEGATSFTFLCALAFLTGLLPIGAFVQAQHHQRLLKDRASRQVLRQAEARRDVIVISRPIPPLFPFFNGLYDRLPDEATLLPESVAASPSVEDLKPLDALFPKMDLGTILGVILTLMAVLLAHDAIVGEREHGTLRLIASAPVTRRTILLAKLMSAFLLAGIALLYGVTLSVALVAALSGGTFELSVSRLQELGVIVGIAGLVIGVFVALGLAISTIARTTSAALALSVALWVVMVIIWPSVAPLLAAALRPVPPNQVFRREMLAKERELIHGELLEHRRMAAELRAQDADVETAWTVYGDVKRRWSARRRAEMGPLIENRRHRVRRQQQAALRLLAISPYGAFVVALGDVCGTGPRDHWLFLDAVQRYVEEQWTSARWAALARERPWKPEPYSSTSWPPFSAPVRSLKERVRAIGWPVAVLVIEWGGLIGVAFLRFDRSDIR